MLRDTQLEKMTTKDLNELRTRIEKMLTHRQQAEKAALRERFKKMAADAGLDLLEVVGPGRGGKRGTVAVKYASPEDPSKTWTGRGRMPNWLSARVKAGEKLDKFLIAKR